MFKLGIPKCKLERVYYIGGINTIDNEIGLIVVGLVRLADLLHG